MSISYHEPLRTRNTFYFDFFSDGYMKSCFSGKKLQFTHLLGSRC